MKVGDKVTYFNTHTRRTATGVITDLIIRPGCADRAIVRHTGNFKHYYDIEIGCFALTLKP